MNKLIAELQRLYFLHDQRWCATPGDGKVRVLPSTACEGTSEIVAASLAGDSTAMFDPIGADSTVRALVVRFQNARDWDAVATLHRALQADLELPVPAISVSGRSGYRLWLSLAECVPLAQAQAFLEGLRLNYLPELPPAHLSLCPAIGVSADSEVHRVSLVPALDAATGKWSAFIDPTMGSMFIEAPGLEMAPNMDRQADLLARLKSIKADDFHRALTRLQRPATEFAVPAERSASGSATDAPLGSTLSVGSRFSDPHSFLLAVMNDPSATADQRICAAQALLPYFKKAVPE